MSYQDFYFFKQLRAISLGIRAAVVLIAILTALLLYMSLVQVNLQVEIINQINAHMEANHE